MASDPVPMSSDPEESDQLDVLPAHVGTPSGLPGEGSPQKCTELVEAEMTLRKSRPNQINFEIACKQLRRDVRFRASYSLSKLVSAGPVSAHFQS